MAAAIKRRAAYKVPHKEKRTPSTAETTEEGSGVGGQYLCSADGASTLHHNYTMTARGKTVLYCAVIVLLCCETPSVAAAYPFADALPHLHAAAAFRCAFMPEHMRIRRPPLSSALYMRMCCGYLHLPG